MSGSVIAERRVPARVTDRRRLLAAAHGLGGYELLLGALLGLMAAARLWVVPQYFRADTWLALTAGRDVWNSGIPHHRVAHRAGGRRRNGSTSNGLRTCSPTPCTGLAGSG